MSPANPKGRLSLQTYIRDVGKTPTLPEKIEISQRQAKMSSRISTHQQRARKFLAITDEEEDDRSFSYEDSHIFVEGKDGLVDLIPATSDEDLFSSAGPSDIPEKFQLALPSSIGLEECHKRRLQYAIKYEIQLRTGQCEDALQAIRMAIGKKAFLFQNEVRKAVTKVHKTRAFTKVEAVTTNLQYNAQLYRRARQALLDLKAESPIIARFKPLNPNDLRTITTFLDTGIKHQSLKHKNLAWFWYLDLKGDSVDNDVMTECKYHLPTGWRPIMHSLLTVGLVYRVNFLRAQANHDRATEEVNIVIHEMDWTVRYFRYMSERWQTRAASSSSAGHTCYALWQSAMWGKFASRADSAFATVQRNIPPPLTD